MPLTEKKLKPIRVMLVDDHEVVRQGLIAVLKRATDLHIVAEADSQVSAIHEALAVSPDVIVMDVRLPDGSGIEACREIREHNPKIHVLMLTSYPDDDAVFASIMAGAAGYLLKEISSQSIIDGIRTVSDGRSLLDPLITGKILQRLRAGSSHRDNKLARLNDREREILELIAEGKTNKQIAEIIFLSDRTVKNYVSSILSKLELGRRSAAAALLAQSKPN